MTPLGPKQNMTFSSSYPYTRAKQNFLSLESNITATRVRAHANTRTCTHTHTHTYTYTHTFSFSVFLSLFFSAPSPSIYPPILALSHTHTCKHAHCRWRRVVGYVNGCQRRCFRPIDEVIYLCCLCVCVCGRARVCVLCISVCA